jgi:hypothetical protein
MARCCVAHLLAEREILFLWGIPTKVFATHSERDLSKNKEPFSLNIVCFCKIKLVHKLVYKQVKKIIRPH